MMKANNALGKFSSTEDFVNTLKKYLSISRICDSNHIADCWPSKKIRTKDGEEYEVQECKTRQDLGFDDEYGSVPNVGVVLTDGAALIMTYNPASGGIPFGAQSRAHVEYLPVGNGYKEFLQYTSDTTGGLAFVMDVNGGRGPNSETINGKYYDIRSLNGAQFTPNGCAGDKINGTCYTKIAAPTPFDCASNPTNTWCSKKNSSGNSYTSYSDDRWAGANNDCEALGGHLPTFSELQSICNDASLKASLGISSGYFWSSEWFTYYGYEYGRSVDFGSCSKYSHSRPSSIPQALCVGN